MSVLAVAYHSITPTWHNDLAVRPERFALQLQKLADRGYKGVTFRDAALGDQDRNVVAITFDDAFATVAEFAVPILRERGWPATVFPVTEAVTSGEPMSWLAAGGNGTPSEELLPLNWEQLSELSELGWEIGSHSRTHRLLSGLSTAELHDEIAGSREDVTAHVGRCASFSYPWGVLSPRATDKVPRARASALKRWSTSYRKKPSQTLSPLPLAPTRFMPSFQSPEPISGRPCSPKLRPLRMARTPCWYRLADSSRRAGRS